LNGKRQWVFKIESTNSKMGTGGGMSGWKHKGKC
jgi:hypothetical protein